jgi:lipopolysaccharide/colanic/teichoic acid biosynthesis glycosyltransferase
MRASRLDELPQLWNVLIGQMSFIGPRPERPEFVAELMEKVPYYTQRLLAKPGLTGWDQVSGEYHSPSVADTNKKLQYDLYYVKNMGLFLDASIFFKTIFTVFMRAGL